MADKSLIAPYAEVHDNPSGPGDARPSALQIIKDEGLEGKWTDKTVLITGGSSGIGVETARALHATGARIFITTRDQAKAEAVVQDILSTSPSSRPIEIIHMELASLESVKLGAADFLSRSNSLHVLINNAGVMAAPQGKTSDGFELQFGTNHLSHFLLTELLISTLIASSTPASASRIVNLASAGHFFHNPGGLTAEAIGDLNFEREPYKEWVAYGRSKTANVLHANQLERLYGRSAEHPVHAFSLHPGGITTGLWKHQQAAVDSRMQSDNVSKTWKNAEQGAATTVWCATAKVWEGKAGRYCEDVQESPMVVAGQTTLRGYAPWARDEEAEKRLWEVSERMVKPWLASEK